MSDVIHVWPLTRAEVKELQPYCPFRYDIAVINRMATKKRSIIPASVHKLALKQVHINTLGFKRPGC